MVAIDPTSIIAKDIIAPIESFTHNIKKSRVYIMLILPSLVASVGLGLIQCPLITLILFHGVLIFGVLKYTKRTSINFTDGIMKNLKTQRMLGFLLATVILVTVVSMYALLPMLFPGIIERVHLPFKSYSVWYFAILAIEFALINPILEEWYWHVFLYKTISHMFHGKKRLAIKLEAFFASYHFFTILYIFDLPTALFGFVMIFIAGMGFLLIRHFCGFLVAAMAHYGADIAVVICFLDILAKRFASSGIELNVNV
jgi:uncharacterized membrane protein YwzB